MVVRNDRACVIGSPTAPEPDERLSEERKRYDRCGEHERLGRPGRAELRDRNLVRVRDRGVRCGESEEREHAGGEAPTHTQRAPSADQGDKDIRRQIAIINSMTPRERRNPGIIDGSRRRRIRQV